MAVEAEAAAAAAAEEAAEAAPVLPVQAQVEAAPVLLALLALLAQVAVAVVQQAMLVVQPVAALALDQATAEAATMRVVHALPTELAPGPLEESPPT